LSLKQIDLFYFFFLLSTRTVDYFCVGQNNIHNNKPGGTNNNVELRVTSFKIFQTTCLYMERSVHHTRHSLLVIYSDLDKGRELVTFVKHSQFIFKVASRLADEEGTHLRRCHNIFQCVRRPLPFLCMYPTRHLLFTSSSSPFPPLHTLPKTFTIRGHKSFPSVANYLQFRVDGARRALYSIKTSRAYMYYDPRLLQLET
jgi:hypothetical protein